MANLLTIPVAPPPDTTKVLVDFYDDTNRQLLLNSDAGSLLRNAQLPRTLEISTVDLLTYYLFYKKRPGTEGYSGYQEIRPKYRNALVEFDGLVKFQNGSLCVISPNGLNIGTTERIGEAIGLSVISKLHGLIEADWAKIKETTRRKTLDYEYAASDGHLLIKAETKGSISDDNQLKSSSVSQHKASIEAKKKAERIGSSAFLQNAILYGTIAVLDDREGSIARCWLLDPPTDEIVPPERFRILARLTAITNLISFISSRSQLAAALQTRLADLYALNDIKPLDGVPLRKGNGSIFPTERYDGMRGHNPWFSSKSCVSDGPAGGQVIQLDEGHFLFLGIREDLLIYAIQQSFADIHSYRFSPGTIFKHVRCSIPAGRFKSEFSLGTNDQIQIDDRGGYVHFELGGYLHYSSSGMVFGVLKFTGAENAARHIHDR